MIGFKEGSIVADYALAFNDSKDNSSSVKQDIENHLEEESWDYEDYTFDESGVEVQGR